MVGLRYARKMESFARVLQSTSRVKRCVYIDLISMETIKEHQILLKRPSWADIGLHCTEGLPEDAIIKSIFDQVNFTISDYVMRHLTGLFCVCYGKWCKDVQIWYEKDGNSSEKQGNVPTRVPWSKVDENSEKIVLRRQEWGLFVLTIFHRWLHYAKIVSRVMWIVEWRHERRIHCVLA